MKQNKIFKDVYKRVLSLTHREVRNLGLYSGKNKKEQKGVKRDKSKEEIEKRYYGDD